MNRIVESPGVQSALVAIAAIACTAVAVAGLSGQFALLALAPDALFAALVIGVVVDRPNVALLIGVVLPFLTFAPQQSQLLFLSLALQCVVLSRCWPAAAPSARLGSGLVLLFGLITLLAGVALHSGRQSGGGVVEAVVYATLLGCSVCVAQVGPRFVGLAVVLCGTICSIAAIRSTTITVDRTIPILGENANGIGLMSALAFVAALSMVCRRWTWWTVLVAGSLFLNARGVYLSGSRGALLAAGGGTLMILVSPLVRAGRVRAAVATIAVGFIGLVSLSPVMSKFLTLTGRGSGAQLNVVTRDESLHFAVQQGFAHPLDGVGLGQLGVASDLSGARLGLRAHDVYAGLFAECGAVALVALLAVCVIAVMRARALSPVGLLPLLTATLIGGLTLEWWGATRTGPVAMLVIGGALGLARRSPDREPVRSTARGHPSPATFTGQIAPPAPRRPSLVSVGSPGRRPYAPTINRK